MSLIDSLISEGYLRTPGIIKAFKRIKREDFVLPRHKDVSDVNAPLSIGHEQTISQPATVAFMMELLAPEAGDKILDVGSGSGWTSALLAELVGGSGRIYAIELVKELKEFGERNVAKYDFIDRGTIKMFNADGYEGLPEYAPFDKILVSAAAEEVPEKLISQLKTGGRMVVPVGERFSSQDIVAIDKKSQGFKETRYPGFVFVPLVKNPKS